MMQTSTIDRPRSHEEAVLRAEIKCLIHALSPYGVLHRDALARKAHAAEWHEGSFARALRAAVKTGQIEALPHDFYSLPHPATQYKRERAPSSHAEFSAGTVTIGLGHAGSPAVRASA